jgi:predicted RNA-binding protein YlxR (DUF448 family)
MAQCARDGKEASAELVPGKVATAACESAAPQRTCIVTRDRLAPDELIRFVLSPNGVVTPDIRRSLPGRGVWVTANRAKVAEAVRRQAFSRAFKKPVEVTTDLADDVDRLLRKDALQALSLANKAGAIAAGFEKARAALISGRARALVEASDASSDSRRKLESLLPASAPNCPPAIIDKFASCELDLALGRSHVIHAALLESPVAGFVLAKALRLRQFELIEKQS